MAAATPATPAPQPVELDSLIAVLREIPRQEPDFELSAADAQRQFGCDAATLDALRAAGLSRGDGEQRFAFCDLHYIGIRLATAREYLWAIRRWRRSLEAAVRRDETPVRIAYVPQLPDEAADGLPGRMLFPDGRMEDVLLRSGEPSGEIEATLRAAWPHVPPPVAALLQEIGSLGLCVLPPHARRDGMLARRLGVVDCWTAAHMIVAGCRDAGFEARIVEGVVVTIPFSSIHMWADVLVDGVWTPVDPVMIATMQRFVGLDPQTWPVERSLGPLLAPVVVTPEPVPLLECDGGWVPMTFLTRSG